MAERQSGQSSPTEEWLSARRSERLEEVDGLCQAVQVNDVREQLVKLIRDGGSSGGNSSGGGAIDVQSTSGATAGDNEDQSAVEQPSQTVIEVRTLIELRPVSTRLCSPEFRQALDRALLGNQSHRGVVTAEAQESVAAAAAVALPQAAAVQPAAVPEETRLSPRRQEIAGELDELSRARPVSSAGRIRQFLERRVLRNRRTPRTSPPGPAISNSSLAVVANSATIDTSSHPVSSGVALTANGADSPSPSPPPAAAAAAVSPGLTQPPPAERVRAAEAAQTVYSEIDNLANLSVVSHTLSSAFRAVLENHIQHRIADHLQGIDSDGAESVISATSTSRVTIGAAAAGPSTREMQREMEAVRREVTEMSRMLQLVFSMQSDMQRTICQSVLPALFSDHGAVAGASGVIPALATAGATETEAGTTPATATGTGMAATTAIHAAASAAATSPGDATGGVGHNCALCLTRPADMVFYRCGHMCTCFYCARRLMEERPPRRRCPMCRAAIDDVIRAYPTGPLA